MLRRPFANWGRTHSCRPAERATPRNERELIELVRRARKKRLALKVVGAAHSWSDIALTDGLLVSLDRLDRLLAIDRERNEVVVEAGIRLKDLNRALEAEGLALPILGSISEQSIAGVISTGTHGSSLEWGNLSTLVTGMRLVTAEGDVLELYDGDERLCAARVGLGALGVITQLTLKVMPAFNLCEVAEPLPWNDALGHFDDIVRSAEYVKLWWVPHTDVVQVFRYHRTHEPPNPDKRREWIESNILSGLLFPGMLWLGKVRPERIRGINQGFADRLFVESRVVDTSVRSFNVPMPPVHRETEAAFAVGRAPAALRKLRELIDDEDLRVNFITEVRVVKGDSSWMSPAYGRDTCQLGAYTGENPTADRYITRFEQIMQEFDARPHWGKETSITADAVLRLWPRARDFRDLACSMDPGGVFRNPFLDRVLGPGPSR